MKTFDKYLFWTKLAEAFVGNPFKKKAKIISDSLDLQSQPQKEKVYAEFLEH